MNDLSIYKQVVITLYEVFDKRRLVSVVFALIALSVIAVGLKWPQTYESSTTLLWDTSQVIRPLLEGTAVTSGGQEQHQIAQEVIYSNKNLEILIRKAELDRHSNGERFTDREIEILKSQLRNQIMVSRNKTNLLTISYQNSSPEEAFLVVSIISKLFIEEITQNKKDESFNAYQFIQSQVDKYEQKLNSINKSIVDFKAENVEVQVDSTTAVSNRIGLLNVQIESASLELSEAIIQRDSLIEQLAIESAKSTVEDEVEVRNDRLVELENRLAQLRLSYTDTYPDIVQLLDQIAYLKSQEGENASAVRPVASESSNSGRRSELYNILKRQIADQETTIKTLEARKLDLQARFTQEIERSGEVNLLLSKLEELSRDQSVTKQLYDKLLVKLENARVSLNLELQSAGALFKVQEPPVIPLVPQGLRFLHFVIASVVLGIGIPIGGIVGLLQIDPRLRDGDSLYIGDKQAVEVLGQVPRYKTPREARSEKFITAQAVVVVTITLAVVSSASVMRHFELI